LLRGEASDFYRNWWLEPQKWVRGDSDCLSHCQLSHRWFRRLRWIQSSSVLTAQWCPFHGHLWLIEQQRGLLCLF